MNTQDQSVRKYRKEIDRNGWQRRLHLFTWNQTPEFTGYCPFFWFTHFCILILPITLFGKLIEFIGKFIYNIFQSDIVDDAPEIYVWPKPDDEDIVELYEWVVMNPILSSGDVFARLKIHTPVMRWAQGTPNWKDFYQPAKINIKRIAEKAARAKARQERNKHYLNLITTYTSWVVKPLLLVLGAAVVYFIYKLIIGLISAVSLADIYYLIKLFISAGTVLVFVLVISGFVKILTTIKFKAVKIPTINVNWTFFDKLCSGIGNGIGFIVETVSLIYHKECPLIVYTNETKPIEKIKKDIDNQ